MGATPAELPILRLNTQRFINLDPSSIVLTPKGQTFIAGTRVSTPGGIRAAQIFKVIWSGYETGFQATIGGGQTRRFDFYIVGTYDAIVAIGDFWDVGNQHNQIDYVFPYNGYEVKAGGTSHGANPSA